MAHELQANDYMVSSNQQVPWHGLGTVLPDENLTADQALKAAKLDWTVDAADLFDADMTPIKGYKAFRRSDDKTVLNVGSETWTPVQNEQLLSIAEALSQAGEGLEYRPRIETAGSLFGGKVVWALVRINEARCLGSEHRSYLLLSNGHDGKRAVKGTLTDVRVVCNNTLRAAEARSAMLSVRHTAKVMDRINAAVKLLGWANEATAATFAIYEALHKEKLKADKAAKFFQELVPNADDKENKSAQATVDKMMHLFRHGPGVQGKTLFDAVNAVTDYVDHHREIKGRSRVGGDARMNFAMFDSGDRLKVAAFDKARELAVD